MIFVMGKKSQSLDLHLPDSEEFPLFIYFHGGGLESGDKGTETVLYEYLVSNKIAVVTANYQMYPDAKYPDYLFDAAEVVGWVIKNISDYGNVTGIYIGGSSAGGYISQMLCFDKQWLESVGVDISDISGYIHDAGQPTCHFNILKERGMDFRRVIIDETAPIYHIQSNMPYPRMLLIVSDNDMQNRYEQTILLKSTLEHFGYLNKAALKVMSGTHCAYVNATDENGESILGKLVKDFIFGLAVID